MADLALPWGEGSLEITLPAHWRLTQLAEPNLRPAPEDWEERLARALSQPSSDVSLGKLLAARKTGRVCIIVEDLTRTSPLKRILPVVLREIRHAGLDDDQVEIFFANGMHPPMSPAHAADKLGELSGKLRWRSNRYDETGAHVRLGTISGQDILVDRGVADADLRIVVSAVSPHLQAGFGGGYKMIFPGCGHRETIRFLHRQGIGRRARQLVGMGVTQNPMRQAIDQAGRLLDERHGRSFAVQYILDAADEPAFIGAGDVLPTHRMTAKQCAVASGVVVQQPADVLLVNAHPRDFDLWQSFKCIANTRWAARPNGAIICLTRCEGGLHGMKIPAWPLSPRWTRRAIRWMGSDAIASLVTRVVPALAGDAAFFVRMATQTVQRNPIYMVSPALHEAGVRFPAMDIFASVDDAIAAADAHLGGGAARVAAFPFGGTTFPVPTRPAAQPARQTEP